MLVVGFFFRSSRNYEQLHIDNKERSWDHQYVLDELDNGVVKSEFYFDELYLTRNASLQIKTGDGISRSVEINKIYGDASGRIYLQVKCLP
jgi:hypothetical protein